MTDEDEDYFDEDAAPLSRSVYVEFRPTRMGRKIRDGCSYLVPAGDNPAVGDYLAVTLRGRVGIDTMQMAMAGLEVGEVIMLEEPANYHATKLYMALFPRRQTLDRLALNDVRETMHPHHEAVSE